MECPKTMILTDSFLPFLEEGKEEGEEPRYIVKLREVPHLLKVQGKELLHNQDYAVFADERDTYLRVWHDHKEEDRPYAISRFVPEERSVLIDYLPEGSKFFKESGNSFFHIGWEALLIRENRMILHASCIDTEVGGILFTGPSGIGKSTQAKLWCQYQGAELINGDRAVVAKEDQQWSAYGSPYAGSSRCYVNKNCRIGAVVVLKQAERCMIRKMAAGEAFCRIFSGLTVNNWDRNFVNRACDLVQMLLTEIPVYELACTPDRDAVDILYHALKQGGTV